ncbi:MAG TPA: hypothetical protein VM510_06340, partial [Caulifigura sp.]|nr:hypothetical protein [Caulifigura sp.]
IVVGTKLDSKAFSIDTGDGGDINTMADWLVNGGMSVKTGSGFDIVTAVQITQSGTSSNLLDLGSDTDVATLALCGLSGPTTINLGSGVGNVLSIDDVVFNNTFTLNSQGTTDVIAVEQNVGLAGATTFAKAAKFNFGLNDVLLLSVTNAASSTKFLSTVAFTGKIPNSTVLLGTNTSFAIAPTVKNVLVV